MLRAAQVAAGLIALVFAGFSILYIFSPLGASAANSLDPIGESGMTNMRALAAPLLAMGLMAAIGAVKKNAIFLAPAALYFLFSIVIRVSGLIVDGAGGSTVRGIVVPIVLFAIAEFAMFVFRRASNGEAALQPA